MEKLLENGWMSENQQGPVSVCLSFESLHLPPHLSERLGVFHYLIPPHLCPIFISSIPLCLVALGHGHIISILF